MQNLLYSALAFFAFGGVLRLFEVFQFSFCIISYLRILIPIKTLYPEKVIRSEFFEGQVANLGKVSMHAKYNEAENTLWVTYPFRDSFLASKWLLDPNTRMVKLIQIKMPYESIIIACAAILFGIAGALVAKEENAAFIFSVPICFFYLIKLRRFWHYNAVDDIGLKELTDYLLEKD